MSTITSPSIVGVTSTVYEVPEPAKLVGVPLVIPKSFTSKSVTVSVNSIAKGIGLVPVNTPAVEVIVVKGSMVVVIPI
ncbi:MAG: hypothetical protein HRT72_04570 [Flavobacteriales bacterium]|nr:hypothetical protein [Flavobacteriales bacterium]